MPTRFDANIMLLNDRLAQLKDSLASPEVTKSSRKRIEFQIRIAKQALQHALEVQQAELNRRPSGD